MKHCGKKPVHVTLLKNEIKMQVAATLVLSLVHETSIEFLAQPLLPPLLPTRVMDDEATLKHIW